MDKTNRLNRLQKIAIGSLLLSVGGGLGISFKGVEQQELREKPQYQMLEKLASEISYLRFPDKRYDLQSRNDPLFQNEFTKLDEDYQNLKNQKISLAFLLEKKYLSLREQNKDIFEVIEQKKREKNPYFYFSLGTAIIGLFSLFYDIHSSKTKSNVV